MELIRRSQGVYIASRRSQRLVRSNMRTVTGSPQEHMTGIKTWKTAFEAKSLARGAAHFSQCTYAFDVPLRRKEIPIPKGRSVQRGGRCKLSDWYGEFPQGFFSSHHLFQRCTSESNSQNSKAYILKDTKIIPISASHVSMFLTPRTRTLPILHLPTRSLILRTPQTRSITSRSTKDEINRLKKPYRGGRNLSERHRTLERALRGKEAFARGKEELARLVPIISNSAQDANLRKESVETFHGFVVPQGPKPPADDGAFLLNNGPYPYIFINHITECCMSGCIVCVYDLYEESLASYEDSITTLRESLGALGIPPDTWPVNVRPDVKKSTPESRKAVIFNTFEEMERKLKEKKEEDEKS
jgi:hypothetical protein